MRSDEDDCLRTADAALQSSQPMSRIVLVLLSCALLLAVRTTAGAQTGGDPPGYSQAVARGLSEFSDKNFAEARAHFVRAHELAPSARTLRALGMVEFELKRYAESARLLSEALASDVKPLDPEKRAHVEDLLDRSNAYLGRVVLDIEPDTSVVVDGITTSLMPGNLLTLEVGDHSLEFQASGRLSQKRRLTVRGGDQTRIQVKLLPLRTNVDSPSTPPPTTPGATSRKESRAVKSPWLWTAIGVLVAGAAVGVAVALTRDRSGSRTEEYYRGTSNTVLGTPR